jgi:hypothetical protein
MENRPSSGSDEPRISPSVSRDKLIVHARTKLSRGYVLIIGTERKNANFFKPGAGYEPCQWQVARMLVTQGVIEPSGSHFMGTIYRLVDEPPPPPPAVPDDDDDDVDDDSSDAASSERLEAMLGDTSDDGEDDGEDDSEDDSEEEDEDAESD